MSSKKKSTEKNVEKTKKEVLPKEVEKSDSENESSENTSPKTDKKTEKKVDKKVKEDVSPKKPEKSKTTKTVHNEQHETKTKSETKGTKLCVDWILESAKVHGNNNVLTFDPKKYKANKTGTTVWVDLLFKTATNEVLPLRLSQNQLRFKNVICNSGAKLPEVKDQDKSKPITKMQISFRNMSVDEIMQPGGDYEPKKKDNSAEQEKENARALKRAKSYETNTNNLVKALGIIEESYLKVVDDLFELAKQDKLEFDLIKNKASIPTTKKVFQYEAKDPKTKKNKKLEHPLVRISLPLDDAGVRVGIQYRGEKKTFQEIVYNTRKINSEGKAELARVKVGGKDKPLTSKTAPTFITPRSLLSGSIDFSTFCTHSMGISLQLGFKSLYVKRHNKKLVQEVFSKEDIADLKGSDEESDGDQEVVYEEKVEKADESDLDDRADEDLAELKKKSKSKSKKKDKKKKKKSSDSEEEEDDSSPTEESPVKQKKSKSKKKNKKSDTESDEE